MEGSIASLNYCRMGLHRNILATAHKKQQRDGGQQVALAGVICARRYKFFNKQGQILPATRPNGRGQTDSLDHTIARHNLAPLRPELPPGGKLWLLRRIASVAAKCSPILPFPLSAVLPELEAGEISLESAEDTSSLTAPPSSSMGASHVDRLDFDEN